MNNQNSSIKLTLIRSRSGRLKKHQAILDCLKLRKIHQTVEVPASPSFEGMIRVVSYLLHVER